MSLTLILDIVYAAVLLICFLIGIFKGWTKTLCALILVFVAGLIANVATPMFIQYVKEFEIPGTGAPAWEFVNDKSLGFIQSNIQLAAEPIDAKLATEHNLKALVCGTLNLPEAFWNSVWGFLKPNLEAATTGAEVRLDVAIAMTAADGACHIVTWVLCYLAIYLIGSIILSIVFAIINGIRKAKAKGGRPRRSALSRIIGAILGIAVGSSLIVGFNTTAHIFTSIDKEGQIYDLEGALGIENGKQVTPSFSGWVYLVTGRIGDTFFPANTKESIEENKLDTFVITLDKDDSTVVIPALGSITQDDLPDGIEEYVTVNSDGSMNVDFPTTQEGYNELLDHVAQETGVSQEEIETYLENAGIEVISNDDGSVTYNINIPTNPEEIDEWLANLKSLGGSGEGEE